MLSIKKIKDNKTISALTNNFKLDNDTKYLYMGAVSDNSVVEFIQYEICNDKLIIVYVSDISGDFSILDGLFKSLLFACDTAKIKSVVLPDKYPLLAKDIGFEKMSGGYVLSIENYSNKCNCGRKE